MIKKTIIKFQGQSRHDKVENSLGNLKNQVWWPVVFNFFLIYSPLLKERISMDTCSIGHSPHAASLQCWCQSASAGNRDESRGHRSVQG